MRVESRNVTKVINTTEKFYIAVDGKTFEFEDDCIAYEKALKIATNKTVLPMFKRVSEYDMFDGWAGCEDYDYGLIKVTEDNLAQLQMFMELNNGRDVKYDGKKHELTMDYIGKTCLFSIGYDDSADFMGSVNEWYCYMCNTMLNALQM